MATADVFQIRDTTDTTNRNSLRGAILAANALGGNNTIVLAARTYRLTRYEVGADVGYIGGLVITGGNLLIVGRGATIDASGLVGRGVLENSVFHVLPGASLKLINLAMTGGIGDGGGIHNDGKLALTGCKIFGNYCYDLGGGGVYNAGTLSLIKCQIVGNSGISSAGGSGGGIFNSGDLSMYDCVVRGNSTVAGWDGDEICGGGWYTPGFFPGCSGGEGGNGGGLYNSGNMKLFHSTISSNACGSGGNGSGGVNSPAGNGGAGGSGGGIYSTGKLTVVQCSVHHNSAGSGGNGASSAYFDGSPPPAGNGGNGGSGGGIFDASGSAPALLVRTQVDLNSVGSAGEAGATGLPGTGGEGPNLFGHFVSRTR